MTSLLDVCGPVHSDPDAAWLAAELGAYDCEDPGVPPLSFAGWLDDQAAYYRSKGSAGHWLSAEIAALAAEARALGALSPAEFDGRRERPEPCRCEDASRAYLRGLDDGAASSSHGGSFGHHA